MKYGVVSFYDVVHSDMDVLDNTFETKISGIQCLLHPPTIAEEFDACSSKNVLPPLGGPWPSQEWWGHYGPGSQLVIKSFGVTVEDNTTAEEIQAISNDIPSWERSVTAWLSVLANGPFEFISNHTAEIVWSDTVPGGGGYFGSSQTINEPTILKAAQWERAFLEAGAGKVAPLARVLFVEGLRAMDSGRLRSAIVDFATATEVALTNALSKSLATYSSPVVAEALLARTKMLGALVALAKDLGLSLPSTVGRDLVEVRNKVIHGGATVGPREVASACIIARDVVDRFVSLPATSW